MEKANVDADALVAAARTALEKSDFITAVSLLREASQLYPLRQDIKALLALALEQAPLEMPDESRGKLRQPTAPQTKENQANPRPIQVDQATTDVALPPHNDFFIKKLEEELTSSATTNPSVGARDYAPSEVTAFRRAQSEGGGVLGSATKNEVSYRDVRTQGATSNAIQETADMDTSYRFARHNRTEQEEIVSPQSFSHEDNHPVAAAESAPASGMRRRSKKEKSLTREETDDLLTNAPPAPSRTQNWSWPRFQSPVGATLLMYMAMLMFIAIASGTTYLKFFKGKDKLTLASAPATQRSVANLAALQTATPTQQEVLRLATDYLATRNYDEAISLITSYLAQTRQTDDPPKPLRLALARAYDGKGTALLRNDKYDESVAAYQKAVATAPEEVDFLLHLANARFYQGTCGKSPQATEHLTAALSDVDKVIQSDSKNLVAYQLKAAICEALQRTAEAQATLSKIIELAPASEEAAQAREQIAKLNISR